MTGFVEQNFLLYSGPPMLAKWLESFTQFPPRARAASFSIDQVELDIAKSPGMWHTAGS